MRIYWLNENLCFHPENVAERLGLERWGDAFSATFSGIKSGHEETPQSSSGESHPVGVGK